MIASRRDELVVFYHLTSWYTNLADKGYKLTHFNDNTKIWIKPRPTFTSKQQILY
jgi:hypothetical protein